MPRVTIPGVGVVNFPYDMPPDQIAAQAKRLHAEAQGKEPPLTRERRPTGTPSALDAGHHPDTMTVERFGTRLQHPSAMSREDLPSDAAILKRAPEVGGAAGMMAAGPVGAGLGAAAGSLVKGQAERGAHLPSRDELGGAALEGGASLALSAVPGLARVAGEHLGPVLAKAGPALTSNAPRISRSIRGATGAGPLAGAGAMLQFGSLPAGLVTSAATRMLTSPRTIRAAGSAVAGAGKAATRVGQAPMHAVNKAGFGLLNVKALLDALGDDPASTVP